MRVFQWPWALALAVAVGAAVAWLVRRGIARRRARLATLGTPLMIERLAAGALRADSSWRVLRLGVVALLIGIAIAGPRWGAEQTVVRQSGIDVVVALDASVSMLATDERPTRLERMKQDVRALRDRSPADRIAILAFAGRSYVLTPLTVDHSAIELFLDNLDPGVVGQAGSALAPPIRQATTLLSLSKSEADQAIVLMSDGEGFDDEAEVVRAAETAGERGVHLVTVGYGTREGSTIPVREEGRTVIKRDQAGQVVVTRHDPAVLQSAALAARGEFVPAEVTDRVTAVRGALDRLRAERRTVRSNQFLAPRFQWFVLPALLLLVADALLATRRRVRTHSRAAVVAAALVLCITGCDPYRFFRDDNKENYNVGTRKLLADSLEQARPWLRLAANTRREEVLYRAGFNLGLSHLQEGLALEDEAADPPLDSTLANYKAVLLRRPADFDSKWNYELALRRRSGGGGGGGAGGGGGGGGGAEQPQPAPRREGGITPQPRFGLSVERAEDILDRVADQERDVQGNQQRRTIPQPPPGGRDW